MTTPSPIAPPMNHVFVDFENVHQVDLSLIGAKAVSFTLMVGPKQPKLDSNLVEKLMEHSVSVRLVKLKTKANNALDFALAYYPDPYTHLSKLAWLDFGCRHFPNKKLYDRLNHWESPCAD